ncbi:hypothetical protein BST61_g4414 [Cercospora zeina]
MAAAVEDPEFPCSLTVHIPFPTNRLALAALRTLSVDQELSPLVKRHFSLVEPASDIQSDPKKAPFEASLWDTPPAQSTEAPSSIVKGTSSQDDENKTVLKTEYKATTNRMLRVSVNGFFESLGTVIQTMEELDLDVVHAKGLESLEGAQGVEQGLTGSTGSAYGAAATNPPAESRSAAELSPRGYTAMPVAAPISYLFSQTNAILTLDPRALDVADDFDERLHANNGSYGALICIPTLLKDNYDMADIPTTGGSRALPDSVPTVDAPAVKALKEADALILGKANLHELALEGLSVSSLGGQTINPYDSTRTPGGSSGETGAAVAASFAVWGTGSDTVNSLRSPASANSLFSCRPTRGLISRSGVIPISYTQDVIGPIGRSVEDVAIALTVMAGTAYDTVDNATALVPNGIKDPVNEAMANTTAKLQAAGATVVSAGDSIYDATTIASLDTQRCEFREGLDAYLQRPELGGSHPNTTEDIYSSNDFLVIPAQHEYVNTALNLTLALKTTFKQHNLDAIIYPEQKNLVVKLGSPSQSGRNGILAALTGTPVVTVPVGFSPASETAPEGVPIGMEILGSPWMDRELLRIAWQIEKRLGRVRRSPSTAFVRHARLSQNSGIRSQETLDSETVLYLEAATSTPASGYCRAHTA